ncbi:MAG: Rrf2 family transcriptional regulator [Candidatus Sumerlaeia bacterium]|nr:Rrf2 family transcriptional regulator [Candidatus Sumerlaeia bacterium]
MSNIFKVSEAASLAIHSLIVMSSNSNRPVTAREVAGIIRASEAHLAKVLQRLARCGLVKSSRGPKGGFVPARDPDSITLLDIYEAIEGPLTITTCLLGRPICEGGVARCCLGSLLVDVGEQVRRHLQSTKLSQVISGGSTNHETVAQDHSH